MQHLYGVGLCIAGGAHQGWGSSTPTQWFVNKISSENLKRENLCDGNELCILSANLLSRTRQGGAAKKTRDIGSVS